MSAATSSSRPRPLGQRRHVCAPRLVAHAVGGQHRELRDGRTKVREKRPGRRHRHCVVAERQQRAMIVDGRDQLADLGEIQSAIDRERHLRVITGEDVGEPGRVGRLEAELRTDLVALLEARIDARLDRPLGQHPGREPVDGLDMGPAAGRAAR